MIVKVLLISFISFNIGAQNFESEARSLASDLKTSLMKSLSDKMSKDGAPEAIDFCQLNVKPIAKKAASDRISKYDFGRTSHKLRNEQNSPEPWAESYLSKLRGKRKNEVKDPFFVHKLADGKQIYLEPLYVQAKCLLCHGENISKKVKDKIVKLYPKDKATGFKLNEFRGFIWVKEK